MSFLKVFSFLILFVTTITCISPANSEEENLRETVATVMKVDSKKIKLKKRSKLKRVTRKYEFSIGEKKYMLNVFDEKEDDKARKKGIELAKIFSEEGLGAKFIGKAENDSLYVTEFIEGKTAKFGDFRDKENLKMLAHTLKKLHCCKIIMQKKSQADYVEKYYESIERKKVALPSNFGKSYEKYKKLIAKNLSGICMALCHNHLNPHNIIISPNKIFLINFGRCGLTNKFEELGYVTLLNGIQGHDLEIFLEEYFCRKPDKEEISAVMLSQKLVCFSTSMAYFNFSESKQDKKIKIKDRVDALDKMLQSENIPLVFTFFEKNSYTSPMSRKKDSVKAVALSFYKSWLELPEE
jgi:thiamine kinase-like enzyme